MASGQVLIKLRAQYSRAECHIKAWDEAQEQAVSLLRTAGNIISRLPVLAEEANYGALAPLRSITVKLLSKQMVALEDVMARLYATLGDLEAAAQGLDKVSRDAQALVRQDRALTPAARRLTAGPVPSIDACLEGLHEIWRMHSGEVRLKEALLAELRYDLGEQDFATLLAAFAAQPNVDAGRVRDLLWVVAATEERRR